MSNPRQGPLRRARVAAGTGFALMLIGFLIALPTGGRADTASPPTTTKATVLDGSGNPTAQANKDPGALTTMANGTTVRVTVSGAAGVVAGANARLCRSGVNIASTAAFNPGDLGNCIDAPFNAQSDDFISVQVVPGQASVTLDFRVGTGTKSVSNAGPTSPRVVTCGDTSACTLWLQEAVTSGGDNAGNVYLHYDLSYGAGVTTIAPSTTAPTTTSPSTTAPTTTAPTTTAPATTTTTHATTTTTAGGTTTTVGGTTTTTVAGPITVSPTSVVPGGSINVTSTGWKASSTVTAVLTSTPVTLGSLTADASGRITGTFAIPAGTATGSHTLTLSGTGADNQARSLTSTVTVTSASATTATPTAAPSVSTISGTLSRTGVDTRRPAGTAVAFILIGWCLLLWSKLDLRAIRSE